MPDDRQQPRITALLSELRQRIDQNLAAFRYQHASRTRSPSRCWHARERLFWVPTGQLLYQRKATVGYQSVPRCGYFGADERPWTDAFTRARCRRLSGFGRRTRHAASAPPGDQLPQPAVDAVRRSADDVGAAVARAGHVRPRRRRSGAPAGHRGMVRQKGAGGVGDRLRRGHVDIGDGAGRTAHRRGRG